MQPVNIHHRNDRRSIINSIICGDRLGQEKMMYSPPPHINLHSKCRSNPSDTTQSNIMTGRDQLRKPYCVSDIQGIRIVAAVDRYMQKRVRIWAY